jgi:hypothetical protein
MTSDSTSLVEAMKEALESKFSFAEARAKEESVVMRKALESNLASAKAESVAIKDILKSLTANVDKLSAKVEQLEAKSVVHASTDSPLPETSMFDFFRTTTAVVAAKKIAMPAKSKDEATRTVTTKLPDSKRQVEKESEEFLNPLVIGDYMVLKSTEGFAKGGLVTGDLSFLRLGKQNISSFFLICVFVCRA